MKIHPIFAKSEDSINGYSDTNAANKQKFHQEGKKLLKQLAIRLDLSDADIRSNMGGIAVPGEVTLHAEHLYIQLHMASFSGDGARLLYRSCKHNKDYSGGTNHYFPVSKLTDEQQLATLVSRCQALAAAACPA
ncbi:MAG: hypothetical protein Q7S87_08590 [Agitococcus sp.]|nr:hypothetical protein [Agitococcus sp.]MDO9177627.1 hypothetical protein [Agitococcus sp.]